MSVLETALELQSLGFAPVYQKGKAAFHPGWNTKVRSQEQLRQEYKPGLNVAVITGLSAINGKRLAVVDVDIRDEAHKKEAWTELQKITGKLPPTTRTGGGGAHYWFWLPSEGFPADNKIVLAKSSEVIDGKPAWTIELLANGHACTTPPSVHPSGKPYEWVNGGAAHIPDAPNTLQEAIKAAQASSVSFDSAKAAQNQEWPEPKRIEAPLPAVSTFPADVLLPEPLRGWVLDEADRMPCPPDFLAAAALVNLGSVIGARCALKPKANDDWTVICNLWGGIVAEPSAKKSPAIDKAGKPLGRLIEEAKEHHKQAATVYEATKAVQEAERDAIKARIKDAAKRETGKDAAVELAKKDLVEHLGREQQAPALRRYRSNDSSVEKLGELLRDNPAGILVQRDELVGLLASWEREGHDGERAFYLEGWNGYSSYDTDRIGRGSIFIPNHCLSIFGGIQPDKLTAYLEQAADALGNDGMLQRFQVLVFPDPVPWEWRDRQPNKEKLNAVFGIFQKLATFEPTAYGAEKDEFSKFPFFRFDQGAQEVFITWSAELHGSKIPKEGNRLVSQHLTKFDKLMPAIALILHLVDCATTGQSGPVSREAALRAAAWCDYLEKHARRCYGLLADEGLRAAQALAEKVRAGKLQNGFTARDVRRNQWQYLKKEDAVEAALAWLEADGWLRSIEDGNPHGGPKTSRYSINPKVLRHG